MGCDEGHRRRGCEVKQNGVGGVRGIICGMEYKDVNSELVVVARFLMEQEFLFARGRLESAGIQCFCANEYLSRITSGIYNGLTGGIELKVMRGDLADAQAILNDPGTPYLVR